MPTYVCFAYPKPVFGPAMRLIATITNTNPAVVTTTFAHGYVTGTIVRLDIPPACGMQQINQQTGAIVVTSPTAFAINIDASLYDAFFIPVGTPPWVNICPQVVPIGEVNETLKAALQNILPS
jgi:hypothetical protein